MGLIGKELVRQSRKLIQYNPMGMDVKIAPYDDLRTNPNTLLELAVDSCDYVYFLAFDVGGSKYLNSRQKSVEYLNNNLRLMDNVFNVLDKYKKPFLFVSSQMSNMLNSDYGKLKSIGESYTKALNGTTVKLWNVYGVEHDVEEKCHVITDFIRMLKKYNRIIMRTTGEEKRQFLHVEDCVRGLITIAENSCQPNFPDIFDLTSGDWISIYAIAKLLCYIHLNYSALSVDSIIDRGIQKDITQTIQNEPNMWLVNNNWWQPQISLLKGLKQVYQQTNV